MRIPLEIFLGDRPGTTADLFYPFLNNALGGCHCNLDCNEKKWGSPELPITSPAAIITEAVCPPRADELASSWTGT